MHHTRRHSLGSTAKKGEVIELIAIRMSYWRCILARRRLRGLRQTRTGGTFRSAAAAPNRQCQTSNDQKAGGSPSAF